MRLGHAVRNKPSRGDGPVSTDPCGPLMRGIGRPPTNPGYGFIQQGRERVGNSVPRMLKQFWNPAANKPEIQRFAGHQISFLPCSTVDTALGDPEFAGNVRHRRAERMQPCRGAGQLNRVPLALHSTSSRLAQTLSEDTFAVDQNPANRSNCGIRAAWAWSRKQNRRSV